MVFRKKLFIGIGSVVVIGIMAVVYTLFHTFQIKKVYIIASRQPLLPLQQIVGSNILLLDEARAKNLLKTAHPAIKDVVVKKIYPDSIELSVIYRNPIAYIQRQDTDVYVGEGGYILDSSASAALSSLTRIETPQIDIDSKGRADWKIVKAGELISAFDQQHLLIDSITIDSVYSVYRIFLPNGEEIIVPFDSVPEYVSSSLQIIIARFRIEGRQIKSVNFQFEKPVITFTK